MIATRIIVASVVPAAIVAARFLLPGPWSNDLTWFFAATGFVTTCVGCLLAAVLLRRRLASIPLFVVAVIAFVVAAILLAIFPTMPNWPFTGVGFLIAWLAMSTTFTGALLLGAGARYA